MDEDDLCVGCQRSADEIRRWGLMSNEERREVLQRCSERLRLSGQLM
ncbi:MAG: Fe-S protein [Pseudomonas sp. BICA1-14]|nr:MAG: Fe-S protein [Pseudomonas sp. BRH_c35]KMQ81930.1 MAG: Fe-S protein [[Pseudomonas] sp. BICA1-14]